MGHSSLQLQVTIGDASPDALELLLRLMYAGIERPPATGQEPVAAMGAAIPTELAVALFMLADRYDVKVAAVLQVSLELSLVD